MKLLLINSAFYPATIYGGPIYSTYELAKALKINGVDVSVVTTNANGNEKLKIKTGVYHNLENILQVKYYKSLDSRGTSVSMLWNLRSEIKKADLVYLVSIFSAPTPFTILICKLLKKPLIISPRGQLGKWCLEQGNRFKKLWLRIFIQPFTHSVNQKFFWHLTSKAEEQDVLAIYPNAKTFVIPNGVSSDLFSLNDKPKNRTFYNKYTGFDCSEKKIIISMGRLHKVKGFDILIEAVKEFQKLVPNLFRDLILLIAGEDFGEKKNLEQLVDKFGLRDTVFLIGKIEGMVKIEFLRNADLFALASHHENFGIVYAEALAAGTPVIASRNTPWQEVEKHKCGRWIENTSTKFAEAISQILNSDTGMMGLNGQKYINDNFGEEIIVTKFFSILESLMPSKHE